MTIDPLEQERLVAYVLGEMPSDEAAALEDRLAGAPHLAETVLALRNLLQTMHTDDTEPPTARVVRRAIRTALHEGRDLPAWLEAASRVVARLVFDSRAAPALAGFRGAAEGQQLAYECDAARVDLHLAAPPSAAGTWRVRGRITGRRGDASQGGPVIMRPLGGHEAAVEALADEHGRFSLEVRGGAYEMVIAVGSEAVALELELR